MKKLKVLENLKERGLITEEVYNEALHYLSSGKSFIVKYGSEISIGDNEILEVLKNGILILNNGKVYTLPLRLNEGKDKKELKLYYRTIE